MIIPTNSVISELKSLEQLRIKWIHSALLALSAGLLQYVYRQILLFESHDSDTIDFAPEFHATYIHLIFGFGLFFYYIFVRGLIKARIFFICALCVLTLGFLFIHFNIPQFNWIHSMLILFPIVLLATWYKYPLIGFQLRNSIWLKNSTIAFIWSFGLFAFIFYFMNNMKCTLGTMLLLECFIVIFVLSTISDWFDRSEDQVHGFKTLVGNFTPNRMNYFLLFCFAVSILPGVYYWFSQGSYGLFIQQLLFTSLCLLLWHKMKDINHKSAPLIFDLILLIKAILLYVTMVP